MAIKWSATVRNAVLDSWETAIGASAIVRMYTGAAPAAVTDAASGTQIASYTLGSDWADAAANGSKAFSSVPLSVAAGASGTLGYYRIWASNGTTCHEQGTISEAGGGGDMIVDAAAVSSGQTVRITSWTKTAPHA